MYRNRYSAPSISTRIVSPSVTLMTVAPCVRPVGPASKVGVDLLGSVSVGSADAVGSRVGLLGAMVRRSGSRVVGGNDRGPVGATPQPSSRKLTASADAPVSPA